MSDKTGRGVYTVFFDGDVDFRARLKKVVIMMAARKGLMVSQAEALIEAFEMLEEKHIPKE